MSDLRYTSVVVDDDLHFAQRVAEFVDGCVVCTVDEFLEWTDPDTIRVALLKPGAQFDGVRARARLLGFSLVVLAPESLTDQGEVDAQFIGAPNENLGALVHSVASGNRLKRERDRLSRQLRHGVRLEAFSRIAGGVAHDFNNLLAVVQGNLEFLERDPDDADRAEFIESALDAAKRGGQLTQQLLTYGRKARLEPV
ncbi:MAG: histidine kinase dimerization/phospho-acceptor domain-containing protein, partial [Myxococcota bacterium]